MNRIKILKLPFLRGYKQDWPDQPYNWALPEEDAAIEVTNGEIWWNGSIHQVQGKLVSAELIDVVSAPKSMQYLILKLLDYILGFIYIVINLPKGIFIRLFPDFWPETNKRVHNCVPFIKIRIRNNDSDVVFWMRPQEGTRVYYRHQELCVKLNKHLYYHE